MEEYCKCGPGRKLGKSDKCLNCHREIAATESEKLLDEEVDIIGRCLTQSTISIKSSSLPTQPKFVAIIGAGAAGLKAANDLLEAGHTVYLIEARDRLGGRAWTDMKLGVPFDKGCQWLHDKEWGDEADVMSPKYLHFEERQQDFIYDKQNDTFSREDALTMHGLKDLLEECLKDSSEDELATEVLAKHFEKLLMESVEDELLGGGSNYLDSAEEERVRKEIVSRRLEELKVKERAAIEEHIRGGLQEKIDEKHRSSLQKSVREKLGLPLGGRLKSEVDREKVASQVKLRFEAEQGKRNAEFEQAAASDLEQEFIKSHLQGLAEDGSHAEATKVYKRQLAVKLREDEEFSRECREIREEKIAFLAMAQAMLASLDESTETDKYSVVDLSSRRESTEGWNNHVTVLGYGGLIEQYGKNLQLKYSATLTVHLNTCATNIDHSGEKIKITTSPNQGLPPFDAIIVTVPTSIIFTERLKFTPNLPGKVKTCFEFLPMGHFKKIALKVNCDLYTALTEKAPKQKPEKSGKSISSEEDGLRELIIWPKTDDPNNMWKLLTHKGKERCNVLTCIVGGSLAELLDKMPDEKAAEFAFVYINELPCFRTLKLTLEAFDMSNWDSDPYSLGAYCYTKVGGKNARKYLRELALKNSAGTDAVFFAGEALWVGHYGTAHGAYLSGEEAASRVNSL